MESLGTTRGTTLSLVPSVAASSADILRSNTRNRKLNSRPLYVREHTCNKTSSAWRSRWNWKIVTPPDTRQLRLGRQFGARLDCGHRSGHGHARRRFFRRRLLSRQLRAHGLLGSSLLRPQGILPAAFVTAGFASVAALAPTIRNVARSLAPDSHAGAGPRPLQVAPDFGSRYLAGCGPFG